MSTDEHEDRDREDDEDEEIDHIDVRPGLSDLESYISSIRSRIAGRYG